MTTANTLAALVNSSSQVVVPSGGINFGTSTDGTGTVTSGVMDDYEEGTWTPTGNGISFVGVTAGYYIKIGDMVHIEAIVDFPTTSSTADAEIQSFPFTIVNYPGFSLGLENYSGGQITILGIDNNTKAQIRLEASALDNVNVSGKSFYFSGTYKTS